MKRMKTSLCVLLSLGMLLGFGACSEQNRPMSREALNQKGMELVEQMDSLAESKAYTQSMTNSEELTSLIEKIGKEDFSKPQKITRIVLPDKAFDAYFSQISGETLSDEIRVVMEKKMLPSVISTINESDGTSMIAVSATLAVDGIFNAGGQQENQLWIYQFPGNYSVVVSFYFQKDGLAEGNAQLVKKETISALEGGIVQWLGDYLQIEELTAEEIPVS